MIDIMTFIPQRIGIFYKDEEWAKKTFNYLCETIPKDIVKILYLDKNYDSYMQLITGTKIMMFNSNHNRRGIRFNKIIIQDGISRDIINSRILPYIRTQNVINEFGNLVY